jgi:endo-beta-N-acetylglucosaminidase D
MQVSSTQEAAENLSVKLNWCEAQKERSKHQSANSGTNPILRGPLDAGPYQIIEGIGVSDGV